MSAEDDQRLLRRTAGVLRGDEERSSASENIIQREVNEQTRRETELAAMYETRQQQQQKSPAYCTPSASSSLTSSSHRIITGDVCRRLHDVDAPSQRSVDSSAGREQKSTTTDNCQLDSCQSLDHPRRRQYSSPGEELVYREMMEQQARENELRRHWKQIYGTDVTPPSEDDIRVVAAAAKPSTDNVTINANNGRRSTRHMSQPLTTLVSGVTSDESHEIRNGRGTYHERQNEASMTSAERPTSAHQRTTPTDLRDGVRRRSQSAGTGGQLQQSQSLQSATLLNTEQQSAAGERTDTATRRRSRDEAELRVEHEILEAMRREKELRQLHESLQRGYQDLHLNDTKQSPQFG